MGNKIERSDIIFKGVRISIKKDEKEIAHGYVYMFPNDHGLVAYLEDIFVEESHRKMGFGTNIIKAAVQEAKNSGCYKIVATSRHGREHVHKIYENFGFCKFGFEFRKDL